MSRVTVNAYTARNVEAHATFAESHPITYRHAVDALSRRRISEEIRQVALLSLASILQGTQSAKSGHADPLPGSAISAAIGSAIGRAKSAVLADETSAPRVADDLGALEDAGALSNGAWLSMGGPATDAVTVWTRRDTLESILTGLAYDDACELMAACETATDDDDGRTTVEALALRVAGLQRDSRAGKALRVHIREILADAASLGHWARYWATVNHAPSHGMVWSDRALELAAASAKSPGIYVADVGATDDHNPMTRNTWSQGDRSTSGPASLVTSLRDGVVTVYDPRDGVRVAYPAASFADVASVAGSALIVPAWQRDADTLGADLFADAQEPMGRVAVANTRKTKRAGGVGGSVTVGRARPRRV